MDKQRIILKALKSSWQSLTHMGTINCSFQSKNSLLRGQKAETALVQETWEIFQHNNPLLGKTPLSSILTLSLAQQYQEAESGTSSTRMSCSRAAAQTREVSALSTSSDWDFHPTFCPAKSHFTPHTSSHRKVETSNCTTRDHLTCKYEVLTWL